jgi:hypothetical protein
VIYESFKPGTEPGDEGPTVMGGAAGGVVDDEDAASMGVSGPDAPSTDPAAAAATTSATTPAVTPTTSPGPRTVPATGTGGLY